MTDNQGLYVRFLRLFYILALVAVTAALAGYYLLAPALVRHRLARQISQHWTGQVHIESVDINNFGPLLLGGVTLTDEKGRNWLEIDSATLTLTGWPGLEPQLQQFAAGNVALSLHREADGEIKPPLKAPADADQQPPPQRIAISNALIQILQDDRTERSADNIDFTAVSRNGSYDISLAQYGPDRRQRHLLKMLINSSGKDIYHVTDLLAARDGRNIVSDGSATVRVADGKVDVPVFFATVYKGSVRGEFSSEISPNRIRIYKGKLSVDQMSVPELTASLSDQPARSGSLSGALTLSATGLGAKLLAGSGAVFLNDADVSGSWLIWRLFSSIGLDRRTLLGQTDAEARFTIADGFITVEQGQMANVISAIYVEPGGKVDLMTDRLDMYVTGALFKHVREMFVERVPILSNIFQLTRRLRRLHVTGPWNEPDQLSITVASVKDVTEGAIIFLDAAATAGGQLGGEVIKAFGELFKQLTPR